MSQSQNKPFKIYKASAGSGKTFTIVKEYLTLCLRNENLDKNFREILAVTFTNKAAKEMKAKILRFLSGIIEQSQSNDIGQMRSYLIETLKIDEKKLVDRAKQLYVKMLHNYSDVAVCTIDSFVQRLSRSFARELELPGQYSVMLDEDDLIDEIVRLLSDEIGKNDFITMVLSHFVEYNLSEETEQNVKKLLTSFIGNLLSEDAYRKGNYKNIKAIDKSQFEEIKKYAHKECEEAKESIPLIINDIEKEENNLGIIDDDYNQKSGGLPSIKKKMLAGSAELATNTVKKILNGDTDWKGKKCKISGDAIVDVYKNAIKKYKSLNTKKIVFETIENNLYLYVLRNHIFELIKKYIDETAQVHISEFNKRISDILGDCSVPFIYERIGERYSNYFVDEFQDTSVLQWQNFLPLIDNSLASGNMNMIVGDAKQSIYRFRNGEVDQIINLPNIYKRPDNDFGKRCESQFRQSATMLSLDKNFRSLKNVVKFNNTFFRYAERYLPLKQIYDDTEQKYNAKEGGYVSVEVFNDAKPVDYYKSKVKDSMLKKIQELHAQGVEYKDITIIVRANDDGTDISNYLVGNGIDVVSAESVLLQTSDKIQLIINTLSSMVDDKNLVTQHTVKYYASACGCKTLFSNKDIAGGVPQGGIYDICAQICNHYGFNIGEDVFLQYFMNTVHEWQCHHSTGIADFLDFWDKKKSKLAVQINGDLNCVNIMTVHKSKGLEYKVVMYPYANTSLKSRNTTKANEWIKCADNQYTKDIPHLDSFLLDYSNAVNTDFEYLLETEKNKTELDNLDLMYVAMTRAKDMLFVYTKDECPKDGYNLFTGFFADTLDIQHVKSENDDSDFDDYFVRQNEFEVKEGEESTYYNYGEFDSTLAKVLKKENNKTDDKILELKEGEEPTQTLKWQEKLTFDPDPTMLWAEGGTFRPDAWGSLVHQILSRIKTIDDAERALRPYVNDGTIDEEQAKKLLATFRKVTDIPELKPAFAEEAIVKNEMDIHTYDGRIIRPDRYAETPQGTILIDYKTGSEHAQYFTQLRDYMSALMQMNPNQNIKAYLVYLGDEITIHEVQMDRLF